MFAIPCNTNINIMLNNLRDKLKKSIENEIDLDFILQECSCCYDTKPFNEFELCQSKHPTCSKCIITHAHNTIYQNASFKIKCINTTTKCDSLYSDKVLEKILDTKVYGEYNKLKIKEETKYIFSMEGLNLIKCQFCETHWDLNENEEILYCMQCYKKTCLRCNELEHKGRPCDKERKIIEESLTNKNFLVCSQCSRCILKEDGCNAVTCPCGNNMCWGCKKQWGNTDAHGCGCVSGVWGVPIMTNNHILNNQLYQDYINKLIR